MGAQWKQKGRELEANKKGKLIGKLIREVMIAAKLGGADPEYNPRLFAALDKARKASVTRDTIDRALKKAAGGDSEGAALEQVTFEGFAPHRVPLVVECLTDNRNRTAPEIRNLFKAGALGQPGSVSFFFNHVGVVEASHADKSRDPESDAIEAGANEVEALDKAEIPEGHVGATFITGMKELDAVSKALKAKGWNVTASEMRYLAKQFTELGPKEHEEVVAFLTALDDHDDVQRVFAAIK
jgi:YebC/PmpR family DNA-binding regulatory protein